METIGHEQILQNLKDARSLLEKGWTTGAAARDKDGKIVYVGEPSAAKFCAMGAMSQVTGVNYSHQTSMEELIRSFLGGGSISYYNDTHTQKDVLELFDAAIEVLELNIQEAGL